MIDPAHWPPTSAIGRDGGTTFFPQCRARLIMRDLHQITQYKLSDTGSCPRCGTGTGGRFGPFRGSFGNRRFPLRVAMR